MTIAFMTLGCKLNYAETSTYERGFAAAGLTAVPWGEEADVYVINTCAVTEHAEKKSRNLIRGAHRRNPAAAIVVTGCYAELRREALAALDGVVRVFPAAAKSRLVPDTLALLHLPSPAAKNNFPKRSSAEDKRSDTGQETFGAYSTGGRTRSFLKVQDGCDNGCAYCTVPRARGRSRNLPIATLLRQARAIAATGIREIVLTGVNTGDFGKTTGETFLDLLKALNGVEGIQRYRISSIEPNLITEEAIGWIASGTKFQPHFHIPLQTGSDTLLKAVGRRYTTAFFADRIDRIRAAMERPGRARVFFGIDIIVGLPGETDARFEETYRFLAERIRPAYLHIFPYSRRPGTRAAAFPDQVQDRIKTARTERLEALSTELHAAFIAANRGLPEQVLWESTDHAGMMSGYTGNYIRLERPYDPALVGTLTDVTI